MGLLLRYCCAALLVSLYVAAPLHTPAHGADLFAVTENLPPYNYLNEDGRADGFSTDVLREVLDRAGLTADIQFFPWPRAYRMALVNPNVVIYTIVRNEERENLFHWVGPFATFHFTLYALEDRQDIVVDSLADASRYRISVVQDSMNMQRLAAHGVSPESLDLTSSEELNVRKLFRDRADIVTGTDLFIGDLVRKSGHSFHDLRKVYETRTKDELYFALSKSTPPETVRRFREGFREAKDSGVIDTIMGRYVSMRSTLQP